MDVQKLLYVLGALAIFMVWILWGYCAYRNITSLPAKFYLRGWTCNIDRRTQPFAFALYVIVALLAFAVTGAFCGLLFYYKLWPLIGR